MGTTLCSAFRRRCTWQISRCESTRPVPLERSDEVLYSSGFLLVLATVWVVVPSRLLYFGCLTHVFTLQFQKPGRVKQFLVWFWNGIDIDREDGQREEPDMIQPTTPGGLSGLGAE